MTKFFSFCKKVYAVLTDMYEVAYITQPSTIIEQTDKACQTNDLSANNVNTENETENDHSEMLDFPKKYFSKVNIALFITWVWAKSSIYVAKMFIWWFNLILLLPNYILKVPIAFLQPMKNTKQQYIHIIEAFDDENNEITNKLKLFLNYYWEVANETSTNDTNGFSFGNLNKFINTTSLLIKYALSNDIKLPKDLITTTVFLEKIRKFVYKLNINDSNVSNLDQNQVSNLDQNQVSILDQNQVSNLDQNQVSILDQNQVSILDQNQVSILDQNQVSNSKEIKVQNQNTPLNMEIDGEQLAFKHVNFDN